MHTAASVRPNAVRLPPPLWAALLLCSLITIAMVLLRLVVFPDRLVSLSYGVALLVCIWHRNKPILYGMSVIFTFVAAYKVLVLMPGDKALTYSDGLNFAMQCANIWVVTLVIHGLIVALNRVEARNAQLQVTNAELEASNEELAATNEELASREEEISRQNEELQSQTEEMEQQAEELRQQAEEMEHQSTELQDANEELHRRQRGLHTLLESARWMRNDLEGEVVMDSICQAALQVMGEVVQAAAVVENKDGKCIIRGHAGFGISGRTASVIPFDRSFARLVMERGQTAYIEDLTSRGDLDTQQPATGKPFRSVLGSPVFIDGIAVAAIKVYSCSPHQWDEEQFHLVEWLAAQCALAMRAIASQQELEVKRRDAEESSLQKTRFLAAVSHDVRTPANAISLLADLIAQTANDPDGAKEIPAMASDLKSNAGSLVDLVSDVLDLARFDTGKIDVQNSDFSLESLVNAEVKQALPLAHSKKLQLLASLPPEAVWLHTDRMKLSRVMGNLIGNAIKFTEHGQIEVRCERTSNGAQLRVVDTGVGISQDQLPRIFDEFYQLRNPERDRSKGTGLGLAICRRLVEGIGCSLSVTSTVGEGTSFIVHVPSELVIRAPENDAAPSSSLNRDVPEARLWKGLRVLLVDDHDITRETVSQLLRSRGAIVTTARLGREALHHLSNGPHDVLLLDLMLPDLDGSDVLRQIDGNWPAGLKCVLVLSGDVREARREEIRQLGAADLIAKPLSVDRLAEALIRHYPAFDHKVFRRDTVELES